MPTVVNFSSFKTNLKDGVFKIVFTQELWQEMGDNGFPVLTMGVRKSNMIKASQLIWQMLKGPLVNPWTYIS